MTEQTFERVTAADLAPGDEFAEARTHPLMRLERIESIGASSRWLAVRCTVVVPGPMYGSTYADRIRPRHTKRFWRVTTTEGS